MLTIKVEVLKKDLRVASGEKLVLIFGFLFYY